jgi:hypothetical protein
MPRQNLSGIILIVLIVALALEAASSFQISMAVSMRTPFSSTERQCIRLYSSDSSSADESLEDGFSSSSSSESDYDLEETLLRVHLSVLPNVPMEQALDKVSRYTQGFPFAAVLPVQPLQYIPTPDGGVNVSFMRKKTPEKGSSDGGIRFFVREERNGIEVVAKRNSEGQTVPKMFAEKLVIQAFVKGISGEESDKTNAPPVDAVAMESFFHKWIL